ncbi:MAG: AI-2E family transporter, partial [Verrucomicrobia bacterium]|nr:AI-2E family transporter [Verrucomicrobiota bacterium]
GVLLVLLGLFLWSLGWLANRVSSVLIPLALAGVLAFILDPVVDFFEARMRSRVRSIFTVFALALLLLTGLAATVLPRLVSEIQSFTSQVPAYVSKVRERVDSFLQNPPHWLPSSLLSPLPRAPLDTNTVASAGGANASTNAPAAAAPNDSASPDKAQASAADPASKEPGGFKWNVDVTASVFAWMSRTLPKVGSWVLDQVSLAASVVSLLAGFALIPVYLFYFLLEKRGIQRRWHEFLPLRESETKNEIIFVLSSINDCLVVFFRGQVLVAMCVGAILTTGFMCVGLNYALLLGVMAAILGVIPYLGVAMSLVPAVAIAVAQFGDWWHPLAVLGVFGLAQMLEGLVISPRIIGDRVGLHPLTIIVSVMIGGTLLGGILGGVLAIPLTAALRTLMFRYVWKRRLEVALESLPPTP